MLQRDVAPGIHRVEDNWTNWYLVESGDRLTIFDAGIPTSWRSLHEALGELGRTTDDLDAVVLTHAHFDHIGFAERARRELRLPVRVHREDVHLTRHPRDYARERPLKRYLLTQPQALPIVAGFTLTRAFWPPPVEVVDPFTDTEQLGVAGNPRIVPTPGHTFGHVAFHFPDRDAVIAGDCVVMLNPYTNRRGPQIVARAAQADSDMALASLDALAATGARTVLTGHGEPWTDGAEAIVARARERGKS
jgi:glyoxylase-like metal-dependent hydrolase (beta-lactamase superfamily II)